MPVRPAWHHRIELRPSERPPRGIAVGHAPPTLSAQLGTPRCLAWVKSRGPSVGPCGFTRPTSHVDDAGGWAGCRRGERARAESARRVGATDYHRDTAALLARRRWLMDAGLHGAIRWRRLAALGAIRWRRLTALGAKQLPVSAAILARVPLGQGPPVGQGWQAIRERAANGWRSG